MDMVWGSITQETLLKNAPFKLSAIVNRIDVRGNAAYGSGLNNSGETRFIFSLIAPITCDPQKTEIITGENPFVHGATLVAGKVPHPFQIGKKASNNDGDDPNVINNGADWKE